jgi:hypothetical protein
MLSYEQVNIRNVSKSEELSMSTCLPLCAGSPELGHCLMQSACRKRARLGHQATSLDHQVGAAEQ